MLEKYGRAEQLDTAATGVTEDKTKIQIDKYGTAEEEYVTSEHLKAYENFVEKVQKQYNLKTREEAEKQAQKLIKDYQQNQNKATSREFI